MSLQVANLDTDSEKLTFDHGQVDLVRLGSTAIGRAVFNPGWRWSLDVAPAAGTSSCQAAHIGVVLSGQFHVRMDDGAERDLGPGDAHVVSPGHDAWVVGDEQCVIIDIGASTSADAAADAVRAYIDAVNRSDAETIASLFTQDGVLMADDFATATGREAIRATYQGAFKAMTMHHEPTVEGVAESGDLAVVRTSSRGTVTMLDTAADLEQAHRELFVLRRASDQWRVSAYMFNSPNTE